MRMGLITVNYKVNVLIFNLSSLTDLFEHFFFVWDLACHKWPWALLLTFWCFDVKKEKSFSGPVPPAVYRAVIIETEAQAYF